MGFFRGFRFDENRNMVDILMDVTRLVDRMLKGRLPTGVDRVGLAWLRHYGADAQALIRFGGRWLAMGKTDSARLFAVLLAEPQAQSPALVRRLVGKAYALSWRSCRGAWLFHTGHSGLDDSDYAVQIRRQALRPVFFLHDLIPMTHPEYCRPGEADKHRRRLDTMLHAGAALVMNSSATRDVLLRYAQTHALPVPPHTVALLAAGMLARTDDARPLAEPYFVMLGTIEPRKNHLLLLNIWRAWVEQAGNAVPRLVLIGQRGWECEQVVDMLERCSVLQNVVLEQPDCDDAQLIRWLQHAQALLFPSFVEGFGIPLIEALQLGIPVLASDLAVFREIAGDIPEYLDPIDGVGWRQMLLEYSREDSMRRRAQCERVSAFVAPDWRQHFVQVDALLQGLSQEMEHPS